MMLGRLDDIVKRGKALKLFEGLSFKMRMKKNKQFVISLNTFEQLFDQGIDSKGTRLSTIGGPYAPYTIEIKKQTGLPTDRVTLFQTGEYYASFNVQVKRGELIIDSDPIKDGDDLRDKYGPNIEGLTDKSIERLAEFIAEDFVNWMIDKILKD